MKKSFILSFLFLFCVSAFASVTTPTKDFEKCKIEKMSFETVAVAAVVAPVVGKSVIVADALVVQRNYSDYTYQASYTFESLETQSYNYSRYWTRNCDTNYSIPKITTENSFYSCLPDCRKQV
jgi:hypothetical protein